MFTNDKRQNAHNMIDYMFHALLPAQGMVSRPAQIDLSHRMLDTLLDDRIALCDAGTGIGKTYAYLAAGTAFSLYRAANGLADRPILISTSSIALQRAVTEEYLPFLSRVLLKDRQIGSPIRAVIRKGKSHYVCDERLERRLGKANLHKKNVRASAALLSLRGRLDMDEAPYLSDYDRERVCVPRFCDCHRETCRYRCFLEDCGRNVYQYQICNHNLLVADVIHLERGRRPILPSHSALIVDEAHKLPEAARQTFGVTLCAGDIEELIRDLKAEHFLLAADALDQTSELLRKKLAMEWDNTCPPKLFLRLLVPMGRSLQTIQRQIETSLPFPVRNKLNRLAAAVSLFCENDQDMVLYTTPAEQGGTMLCATLADLTTQLQKTLWSQSGGTILTSATLAVGDSFRHYRETMGLQGDERVSESVSLSPFDYKQNCLLYLPKFPPQQKKKAYFERLTNELVALLRATSGHALVLFTSYASMASVRDRLKQKNLSWPVFTMGHHCVHRIEQFRQTPGSVLLSAGAAWEGFNFPGDCVSLLVIPRLPFAYPDALKERERKNYPTLRDFIQTVVTPEMQIKLKQGFGRAIRTETDTCVIAILDERANPEKGRYFRDMTDALPEMQITRSLEDVEKFIRKVKSSAYFLEAFD